MALDESTENLERLESNGITAYIDARLKEHLVKVGSINVDFITSEMGSGYRIKVGDDDCSTGGCEGCSGHDSE
jgi:Fe-S cluster assembly iron-binding protein IscA